jgi:hypothetical protein
LMTIWKSFASFEWYPIRASSLKGKAFKPLIKKF